MILLLSGWSKWLVLAAAVQLLAVRVIMTQSKVKVQAVVVPNSLAAIKVEPQTFYDRGQEEAANIENKIQNVREKKEKIKAKHEEENDGNRNNSRQRQIAQLKCRASNKYFDFEDYKLVTCAKCYSYLPRGAFSNKLMYDEDALPFHLFDARQGIALVANDTDAISATFANPSLALKWLQCCKDAVECCERNSATMWLVDKSNKNALHIALKVKMSEDSGGKCEPTWDGWGCWPATDAGVVAQQVCPAHVYINYDPICSRGVATKQCLSDASWFKRDGGHEWSNYSTCDSMELYRTRFAYACGVNVVSIVMTVPSIFIFIKMFKTRRSKRIKVHLNLIVCLCIYASLSALLKFNMFLGNFQPTHVSDADSAAEAAAVVASEFATADAQQSRRRLLVEHSGETSGAESALVRTRLLKSRAAATKSNFDPVAQSPLQRPQPLSLPNPHPNLGANRLNGVEQDTDDNNSATNQTTHNVSQAKPMTKPIINDSGDGQQISEASAAASAAAAEAAAGAAAARSSLTYCWLISMAIRCARNLCYAWMFTEAAYLHLILKFAPKEPAYNLLAGAAYTWPIINILVYTFARASLEQSPISHLVAWLRFAADSDAEKLSNSRLDPSDQCWLMPSKFDWIERLVNYPNFLLIVVNSIFLLFLLNTMLNLQKVPTATASLSIACRNTNTNGARASASNGGAGRGSSQSRSPQPTGRLSSSTYAGVGFGGALRAIALLFPLYGLHYMLARLQPDTEICIVEQSIHYLYLTIDGLQGALVAIIFCYATGDAQLIIKQMIGGRSAFYFRANGCNANTINLRHNSAPTREPSTAHVHMHHLNQHRLSLEPSSARHTATGNGTPLEITAPQTNNNDHREEAKANAAVAAKLCQANGATGPTRTITFNTTIATTNNVGKQQSPIYSNMGIIEAPGKEERGESRSRPLEV